MEYIKSRYKNPDKFIEKLKGDIEYFRSCIKDMMKSEGKFLLKYVINSEKEFTLNSREFGNLKLNQTVILTGTVTDVHEYLVGGAERSSIEIEMKYWQYKED